MEVLQNLLANAPLLIVFAGMFALVWRSLSIAHDLSTLALQASQKSPAAPVPTPQPTAQSPHPAQPSATVGEPVDEALVAAVKKFEGFSAKAYGDYKQYSIGYGTKANSPTEVIDEPEADKRLRAELAVALKSVDSFCPNAPKGVKQAMIDLTYNVGPVWQHNDLGKLIQSGSYEDAKAHVLQYNHAGGQVNDGLTKRRQAEVSWFDNPL